MKIIVGLGNPGKEYEETRHNVGFLVVDRIAAELGIDLHQTKFKSVFGEKLVAQEKVILLKPLTYMNLSGEAVAEIAAFYKLAAEDLLIIYDDLDLPVGKIRLRFKGSSGGHNGMKSIIRQLGTEEFKRIRVGIGRPASGQSVVDYVLSPFLPAERQDLERAVERAAQAALAWLEKPFAQVMNEYNQ
ncbi:aminoacyl-tRNA hydrolase [Bacillaceae bacterium]